MRFLILFSFFLAASIHAAPIDTYTFKTPAQARLFYKISGELRCLVCQNESISDSNADLAKDLRHDVYTMIEQGKTEKQIIAFMVQRYGDYVLYRPPFKPLTWLLWLGPVLIFFLALFFGVKIVRGQPRQENDVLSPEEQERINSLHKQTLNKSMKGKMDKESKYS